mgnify:CR=1 FL=1
MTELFRKILTRGGRFVLEFHGVSNLHIGKLPYEILPNLTPNDLKRILVWLQSRNISFLSASEFLSSTKAGVLMTFDDGLANFHTNAFPLLMAHSVPAVIFVTTQHVQQPNNWIHPYPLIVEKNFSRSDPCYEQSISELFNGLSVEQISEISMNSLITIGSHTVTHPLLTKITGVELEYELSASKDFLQDITGKEINLLAYPTGDYDERVVHATIRAGYRAAFAEYSRKLGNPTFEIPRVGIYSSASHYLAAKLSGIYMKPLRSPF